MPKIVETISHAKGSFFFLWKIFSYIKNIFSLKMSYFLLFGCIKENIIFINGSKMGKAMMLMIEIVMIVIMVAFVVVVVVVIVLVVVVR